MDGGGEAYILYIVILAIVGIATLVRKAIEKASSGGEKGKKMNLAQIVQRELQKYMRGPEVPTARPPAAQDDGDAGETDRPAPRPRFTAPPPAVEKPRPLRPPEARAVPTLVDARTSLQEVTLAPRVAARPGVLSKNLQLDRKGIRQAVVLAEILGPPVGERQDYRLF